MNKLSPVLVISLGLTLSLQLGGAFSLYPAIAEKLNPMSRSKIITGEKAAAPAYGETITKAKTIVLGSYKESGIFSAAEVLKGDKTLKGQSIKLEHALQMGCRLQPVPDLERAVLFLDDKNACLDILDITEHIDIVKELVPIYNIASEKERLSKLSEKYLHDKGNVYKKELPWALTKMKDKDNFALVTALYFNPALQDADKMPLQEWLSLTLDRRALPVLIKALHSKDKYIASDAVCKLSSYYAGPETDTAFSEYLPAAPESLKPTMSAYLARRKIKTGDYIYKETPYARALSLQKSGKYKEALDIYLSLAASKNKDHADNSYVIRTSMLAALDCAGHVSPVIMQSTREKLLATRLSWLNEDALKGNYLELQESADILRKLKDTRCLPALSEILKKRDSLFDGAVLIATCAIHDQGAGGKNYNSAAITEKWSECKPLSADLAKDEGAALINVLNNRSKYGQATTSYAIYRLGDLKERRAESVLLEMYSSSNYVQPVLVDALRRLATPSIQNKLTKLASDKHSPLQAQSVELLGEMQKEKALPLMRKVIKDGELSARMQAAAQIAKYGNSADRKTIAALADYWTGDRENHYWLVQALSQMNAL